MSTHVARVDPFDRTPNTCRLLTDRHERRHSRRISCLLYTSDAADERSSVDLGGRRIIKKKTTRDNADTHTITQKQIDETVDLSNTMIEEINTSNRKW